MNFSKEKLKQLAVESSWMKRYSITTGRMVEPIPKWKHVTGKSVKKVVVDEAKSGIVYEGELTEMGKSN